MSKFFCNFAAKIVNSMKYLYRLALVALLCISYSLPAFSWGQEGHRIIAKIAYDNLRGKARKQVDAVSDAIDHHEESLGRTAKEEHIHVDADPCLMLWTHVIAVDDDRCGNGDSDGWYPPQQAQPPLFCPMTDIYQINV